VIFFDALIIKIRDGAHVRNKAAHIAVGVDTEGIKHVLGIWVQQTEGAKFWAGVHRELANRDVLGSSPPPARLWCIQTESAPTSNQILNTYTKDLTGSAVVLLLEPPSLNECRATNTPTASVTLQECTKADAGTPHSARPSDQIARSDAP
jgi:hypothetical protein